MYIYLCTSKRLVLVLPFCYHCATIVNKLLLPEESTLLRETVKPLYKVYSSLNGSTSRNLSYKV